MPTPPESKSNASETHKRRSQTKKEIDALGELVRLLKPFDPETRAKLFKTAQVMLES